MYPGHDAAEYIHLSSFLPRLSYPVLPPIFRDIIKQKFSLVIFSRFFLEPPKELFQAGYNNSPVTDLFISDLHVLSDLRHRRSSMSHTPNPPQRHPEKKERKKKTAVIQVYEITEWYRYVENFEHHSDP